MKAIMAFGAVVALGLVILSQIQGKDADTINTFLLWAILFNTFLIISQQSDKAKDK